MGIANIINNSTTTSGGEIVRELVNSSDGAGLHFDGVAGGIDLGSSMPDLGTQYSLEFIVNGDSKTGETYLLDAYKSGARIIFGWSGYSNGNIQLHINGTWSSAFMATPDNGEVVHLVLSVDGTSATLYQNGNSVSTQTVVANTMTSATSTRIGCSQNGTGNFFNGTIYRARFYNRALSSTDVQTAYEHASVVQTLRWGSSKLLNGTAWTGASGTTPPTSWTAGITGVFTIDSSSGSGNEPSLKITRSSNNPYIYQTFTSVVGRRYRVRYRVKNIDATNVIVGIGSTAGPSEEYNQSTYTSTSWANYEATFTATTVNFGVYVQVSTTTGTQSGYIDSLEVFEDSLASDYDLAFANPTQSLMVQDRTGEADGTATATGVTQVQPVVQLNSTSARIGTVVGNPPDGELYVSSKARIGQYSTQGGAILGVRNQGDSINFGHNNSAGYGSTIGCGVSNGWPHLALMCEAGTNVNTFKTRGLAGNVIYATNTGQLRFGQVTTADADNQTVTDRLTIDSTGQSTFTRDGGLAITSNRTTDDGDAIHVRKDNYTRLRLGTLGITFPNGAGAAPTAAAENQLDYYKEGTFTPTFYGGTTAGTYTIGTAVGKYTRIGNMVTVNVSLINITESSAGSGQVIFGGFPFPSGSSSTQGYIGAARVRSYTDAGSSPIVYMGGGATVATMSQYSSGTADQICQVSGISSGNTDISFSLTYFV